MTVPAERAIVLWYPDWPTTAAARQAQLSPAEPLAVIDRGLVFACTESARAHGVHRGQRLRQAQAQCPGLTVLPYDSTQDARAFEPIVTGLEDLAPGIQVLRPGTCAWRARGPSRFYGGEESAAAILCDGMAALGLPNARIGIADGRFAAEQAARSPGPTAVHIVGPGGSPRFLAPLSVRRVADDHLATLLDRLGIRSLGDLAALPADDVRDRFGPIGAELHARASGQDATALTPRETPARFDLTVHWEPPLDDVDTVAFAVRAPAEEFSTNLTSAHLVCTALNVELESETGQQSTQVWLHPRWFTAADIVDRVRWQVTGESRGPGSAQAGAQAGLTSGIARLTISPEQVDATWRHEPGLWGAGPPEVIHHVLSRIQGLLGHEGVATLARTGGRMLLDRQSRLAWGDRRDQTDHERMAVAPWPGSLPGLAPTTVFHPPRPVELLDEAGAPVEVAASGELSGPPAFFGAPRSAGERRRVQSWAGPWPVSERWWDPARARFLHRVQLVDATGMAWLLILENARWTAEARYD